MGGVFERLRLRSRRQPEEAFIKKAAGSVFTISYDVEITQRSPGPKIPPYHEYNVRLKLSYTRGGRGRSYKAEIASGTMTQRVESIANDAARNAIRAKIPVLLELLKKYDVSYRFDDKTKSLLQADVHFIKLE
jgi:hypothetical protein